MKTRRFHTADKSMRLAELVLLSQVFIFVGVTPPLLPFICEGKQERQQTGREIHVVDGPKNIKPKSLE